jgi:predicted RNA binding protein YcfA (HicA-like mRNA interferase family)
VKLPRDVDAPKLVTALRVLGYAVIRQKGSHIRVTTQQDGENHEVIPHHHPIKTGTLAAILQAHSIPSRSDGQRAVAEARLVGNRSDLRDFNCVSQILRASSWLCVLRAVINCACFHFRFARLTLPLSGATSESHAHT